MPDLKTVQMFQLTDARSSILGDPGVGLTFHGANLDWRSFPLFASEIFALSRLSTPGSPRMTPALELGNCLLSNLPCFQVTRITRDKLVVEDVCMLENCVENK